MRRTIGARPQAAPALRRHQPAFCTERVGRIGDFKLSRGVATRNRVEVLRCYSKTSALPKLDESTTDRDRPIAPRIHRARKRLGPDAVSQLVAEYESGTPTTELMAHHGRLGKGTVLRLTQDHGVKLPGQGLPAEELPQAIELYRNGWSLQRLGERFTCDAETVRKRPREAGVEPRDCHERVRRAEVHPAREPAFATHLLLTTCPENGRSPAVMRP